MGWGFGRAGYDGDEPEECTLQRPALRRPALRRLAAVAAVLAASLALSGCTEPSPLVEGSTVAVAVAESFTSANPLTGYGSASATNASVASVTSSAFAAYDEHLELVPDESFGRYEVVAEHPLTVKFTIAEGVRWSDGVRVDAADLLLAWAANSRVLNDREPTEGDDAGATTPRPERDVSAFVDPETGLFTEAVPRDLVYFDGFTGGGLQHVTQTPEIGDGGRSLTLVFDEPTPDWPLLFSVGVPAHVVAGLALGAGQGEGEGADPLAAKDSLIEAITARGRPALAALSRVWNTAYNFSETPANPALLLSNGPYTITEIVADDHLTLTANPHYRGAHQPTIAEITVRFIADPLQAAAALADGTVQVAGPQPGTEVLAALGAARGIRVLQGVEGTFEQLELQLSGSMNGAIEHRLVREALLTMVPRERILEELVRPVQPGATVRLSHVFMPGQPGYDEAAVLPAPGRYGEPDAAAARTLLAEAALTDAALAAPTVCILFDPANPRRVAEFALIRDSAAEAGITVTDCSTPDWRGLLGAPGAYDAALYGLRAPTLSVSAVEARLRVGSPINHNHYAGEAVQAALDALSAGPGEPERGALLAEIDAALWADAAALPLYQWGVVTGVSEEIAGVLRSPLAPTVLWNSWEWEPAEAL